MKVIIAGSRDITDQRIVNATMAQAIVEWNALEFGGITEVVSGGARGVDALGEAWGKANSIPVIRFPADWTGPYKKAAGFIRNKEMAAYADALVAIWDGKSRGTAHMINSMEMLRKPILVVRMKE